MNEGKFFKALNVPVSFERVDNVSVEMLGMLRLCTVSQVTY